ncbi:minichromosome maintenance protein MCM [Halolamina salifodinae]|uniref:Replicative DNA helicase Mcm n=1 Tax=Halolamina salifodinae TaxID=1202767 RepID=A0A8T4GVD1_9EURY|nr:minichromosome maintenance protein MCM [Halolamina salifodinae]MBP1986977.1 replicative DNA helicase Mcm [Halolamina salifodinae]
MIDQLIDTEPERNEGLVKSLRAQLEDWNTITYSYDSDERTQTIEIDWDACVAMEKDLDKLFQRDPTGALFNLEIAAEEHLEAHPEFDGEEVTQYIRFTSDDADGKRIDETMSDDVGTLVHITASVDQVYPKHDVMTHAIFRCVKCGTRNERSQKVVTDQLRHPSICVNEECNNSANSNFVLLEEQSTVKDHQIIKLSDEATADRQGEEIDAHLFHPFLDSVEVGESVTITAIPQRYRDNQNDLTQERELVVLGIDNERESYSLSEEERERFQKIVDSGNAEQVLHNSLAPHIVGEDIRDAKQGVLYATVSGNISWMDRPDLNIPLIGDPAVGKTQILDFVEDAVSQSMLSEGGATSKAGLLGMAMKDERTGKWYAHAGPYFRYRDVMVDELADMKTEDISKLKSALESQSHTITMGDVRKQKFTTDGSFLAASNPIDGKFDEHEPLDEQYDFDPAVLSRFDLIYIIQDSQDEDADREKAMAVMNRYQEAAAEDPDHDRLSKSEFGKFVEFLKEKEPAPPGEEEAEHIADKFAELREDNSDNIDLRNIETVNRIAAVSARLNGHDQIQKEDLSKGFEMFVGSVNQLADANIDKSMLWSGRSEEQTEAMEKVVDAVEALHHTEDDEPTRGEVERRVVMNNQLDQQTIQWAVDKRLEDDTLYEDDEGVLHTTKK